MELIPFFSTAILIATIASIVLAITSYIAYKARERRRPNRRFPPGERGKMVFFHRCDPNELLAAGAGHRAVKSEDG
ncbi:MAG: hypothetical protein GF355_15465 [Candidatus Eisenbacteria bacterium]|nr:hypothetical protein [Candidatus Eisenbacteria bacterium]